MVNPSSLSLVVVGHPSVTMGVTDTVFGPEGRLLTVMELLSGAFKIGCHRAPDWSSLGYKVNFHYLVLYMVM